MTLAVKTTTGLKSTSILKVRDASNTLQNVQQGWRRDASGIKEFFGKLTVEVSPPGVSGSVNRSSAASATTRNATANVSGGVAPFTYAWARTDGGAHSWTINSPASAITSFSTPVSPNSDQVATFACTVTDATGTSATSANVSADCWNDGGSSIL
jgi:uncharacterized protein YukE